MENEKKKILVVVRGSFLNRGMNTGLENLAFGLSERGYSVKVISGGNPPQNEKMKLIPNNILYKFMGNPSDLSKSFAKEIKLEIENSKIDVLIGRVSTLQNFLSRFSGNGKPFIIANEGLLSINWKKRVLVGLKKNILKYIKKEYERIKALKRIDKVVCISYSVEKSFCQNNIIDMKKVTHIYRGANIKAFLKSDSWNNNEQWKKAIQTFPTLIFFGNVSKNKGVEDLVKSLKYIKTPVEVKFCGKIDEEYKIKLKGIAVKENVEQNKLHFLGPLGINRLNEELTKAHIFVFPSWRNEGLGKSLIEAMAAELPVICTDLPAFKEVVKHEKNGLIVPLKSPNKIADAISKYQNDPDFAIKCAQNGKKTVIAHFSFEKEVEEYVNLIENK